MRPTFCNIAVFQDYDLVAIVYCAQPVRNKDTRPRFFLQDAIDVLEQCLFSVCIESRSLCYVSNATGDLVTDDSLLHQRRVKADSLK